MSNGTDRPIEGEDRKEQKDWKDQMQDGNGKIPGYNDPDVRVGVDRAPMKEYRVGQVSITEEVLCSLLGYPGGKIGYAGWSEDRLELVFNITHPDMPYCKPGDMIKPATGRVEILRLVNDQVVVVRRLHEI